MQLFDPWLLYLAQRRWSTDSADQRLGPLLVSTVSFKTLPTKRNRKFT